MKKVYKIKNSGEIWFITNKDYHYSNWHGQYFSVNGTQIERYKNNRRNGINIIFNLSSS